MRINQDARWARVVEWTYGGEGVTFKLYVYTSDGKICEVCYLALGLNELLNHRDGVLRRRDELEQGSLW